MADTDLAQIKKQKQAAYLKKYRLENKSRISASRKDYISRNKERTSAVRKEHRENNRDKIASYMKQWRETNKEKRRLIKKKWDEDNKERNFKYRTDYIKTHKRERLLIEHQRRARKLKAEGKYILADIDNIFRLQRGKCAGCKCTLNKYHIDHIMPISRGGSNWPKNLQLLCPLCNSRKHNKLPEDWSRENGLLI